MIALDTNVIIDLSEGTAELAARTLDAIERNAGRGRIVVCGVVYAELCSAPHRSPEEIATALRAAQIAIEEGLTLETWAKAGAAYGSYLARRRASGGGDGRRILADFLIGAHATTAGTLITNDGDFYRRCFPDLRVVAVR